MKQVQFRFYAELNDFLPQPRRQVAFVHHVKGKESVKHSVESLGVPHIEVDLILANGESVDFSYLVNDGDRISVFPVFESIDISPIGRLRPHPLRETRFVMDIHLGQLAKYLRLIGFDTLYRNDYGDEELARISIDERRILLTKDQGLLKRKQVTHGYYIRGTDPSLQIIEVVNRFDLQKSTEPFTRCLRCNGELHPAEKKSIVHRLQSNTRQFYDEFWTCALCDQIYWKGSHYKRMHNFLRMVLDIDVEQSDQA